jgi:hypothetical protein
VSAPTQSASTRLACAVRDSQAVTAHLGLLQPIGVDAYYQLIFNARRLEACADILGWKRIPCIVLKLESVLAGEYAENEFRKQLTTSERTAIRRAVEAELGNRLQGDGWKQYHVLNCRDLIF